MSSVEVHHLWPSRGALMELSVGAVYEGKKINRSRYSFPPIAILCMYAATACSISCGYMATDSRVTAVRIALIWMALLISNIKQSDVKCDVQRGKKNWNLAQNIIGRRMNHTDMNIDTIDLL